MQFIDSQFTGCVIKDHQSESVYCLLDTLHKLKHLSSSYSVGNHASYYAFIALSHQHKDASHSPTQSSTNCQGSTQVQGPELETGSSSECCSCLHILLGTSSEDGQHWFFRLPSDFQIGGGERGATKIYCSHSLIRFDTGLTERRSHKGILLKRGESLGAL